MSPHAGGFRSIERNFTHRKRAKIRIDFISDSEGNFRKESYGKQ
jgi:hypothetical protein